MGTGKFVTLSASDCGDDAAGENSQRLMRFAGLQTCWVVPEGGSEVAVVLLHGYAMDWSDLSPFAHSLRLPAHFLFPRGAHSAASRGHAWWPIAEDTRRRASNGGGARDLHDVHPPGLPEARDTLDECISAIRAQTGARRIVLGGFSQGAMLACDTVLNGRTTVDALVLLSASRLAFDTWAPHAARLKGLPVFVSHGREDDDLSFAAGERLRAFAAEAGALTTWLPFDGGHQIPLTVWRALRKFLLSMMPTHPYAHSNKR